MKPSMPRRFQLRPHFDRQTKKWLLNIPKVVSKTGKRQRLFYDTQDEATLASRRLKRRYVQFGVSLTHLTPSRLAESGAVYQLLDEHHQETEDKPSLYSIVVDYLNRYQESHSSISFAELIDEYIAARQYRHPQYLKKYEQLKGRMNTLTTQKVSQITSADVEKSLPSGSAKNPLVNYLSVLFNYGLKKGYLSKNPVNSIEKVYVAPKEVEILDVPVVEGMLKYANLHFPKVSAILGTWLSHWNKAK